MFCEKCGAKIEDDAAFCPKCGAKVNVINNADSNGAANIGLSNVNENMYKENESIIQEKFNPTTIKSTNKLVGILAVVLVAVIAIFIVFVNRKQTVDLNKYVDITYYGYNTVGKASAVFNQEKFKEDFGDRLKFTNSGKKELKKKLMEEMGEYGELGKDIDIENAMEMMGFTPLYIISESANGSLDKTSGLSNGDKVVYSWNITDEDTDEFAKYFNYNFKYSDIEGTVEGLEDAQVFDPFAGITVSFLGIAPSGEANFTNSEKGKEYSNLQYSFDKQYGLSNGDEVTLSVSGYYNDNVVDYCLENFGKIPSPLEKKYTVGGLSSYVSSVDEIGEDMLNKLKSQTEDNIKAYSAKWDDKVSLVSSDYVGIYFLNEKEGTSGNYHNITDVIYKVVALIDLGEESDYKAEVTFYYYTKYNNIMQLEDGTISVNMSDYSTPSYYFNFDTGVESGWFGTYNYSFYGYDNVDSMFNDLVTQYVDRYSYESTVSE